MTQRRKISHAKDMNKVVLELGAQTTAEEVEEEEER